MRPNYYVLPQAPDLLAGEYPGHPHPDHACARLAWLIERGVSWFLDLTEDHELDPYDRYLPHLVPSGHPAPVHRRIPIRDLRVPERPQRMTEILDTIDRALADGHRVYLHCRGGVGRTGTVAGCWLVRNGLAGDEALAEVARRFAATEHGRSGMRSPETDNQAEYVRTWRRHESHRDPAARAGVPVADRIAGSLLGLAVGDALGTTLEFTRPGAFEPITDLVGGGPFRLAPGQWTDDTSMALCLAESLVTCGGFDARDQMTRYLRWWREGDWSSTGRCFDIGDAVHGALRRFEETGDPMAGSADPGTAGNGSLMRLAPVALYHRRRPREAVRLAAESSRTTHAAPVAVDACRYFAALLLGALRGLDRDELLDREFVDRLGHWHGAPLDPVVAAIARGSWRGRSAREIRASGYVAHTLEAALWAFAQAEDFASGALAAVNLGEDADTTGAVYGQLAGAYFGARGIPDRWTGRLAMRDAIGSLAGRLAAGPG